MSVTLPEIYLLAGGVGFVFIMASSLMSFANAADGGGADGGDMSNADTGGDMGSGDAGGDMGGGDAGGDMGGGDAGGDMGGGDASGDMGSIEATAVRTVGEFRAGLVSHKSRNKRIDYSLLFLKLISPSTITSFLFFFGLSGFFLLYYMPWLGNLSLVGASVLGVAGYNFISYLNSAISSRMHVSTSFREESLIGHPAEVSVSISKGGMGEITYVVNAVRTTAPARAVDKQATFKHSSKVLISDIKDGIVFVDECPNDLVDV